jgi:hypothetical protein
MVRNIGIRFADFTLPSSSGPGHRVFIPKIVGSNPAGSHTFRRLASLKWAGISFIRPDSAQDGDSFCPIFTGFFALD